MLWAKHLDPSVRFALLALAAVLLLLGVSLLFGKEYRPHEPAPEAPEVSYEATNFVKVGTLVFPNAQPTGQDTIYFSYPNPGGPTTTLELTLDEQSICASPSGALPCIAMSVQYHMVFANKRASVEAIEKEARVVVRKLTVLGKEGPDVVPGPGIVYIPWMQAVRMIEACEPTMVLQTHSRNVHLTLKDGRELVAVEPVIDELFKVTQRAGCADLPIATE
jgi:hypothetical protein